MEYHKGLVAVQPTSCDTYLKQRAVCTQIPATLSISGLVPSENHGSCSANCPEGGIAGEPRHGIKSVSVMMLFESSSALPIASLDAIKHMTVPLYCNHLLSCF